MKERRLEFGNLSSRFIHIASANEDTRKFLIIEFNEDHFLQEAAFFGQSLGITVIRQDFHFCRTRDLTRSDTTNLYARPN